MRRQGLVQASILAIAVSCSMSAEAQLPPTEGDACSIPQSPRDIRIGVVPSPYNRHSKTSSVTVRGNTLLYRPLDGSSEKTLHRCGEHIHQSIENLQSCEYPTSKHKDDGLPLFWIEHHYVYASKVAHGHCNPEHLDCCLEGPFVVLASQIGIMSSGIHEEDFSAPSPASAWESIDGYRAEWSGSTTGPDAHPGECKPAAHWVFFLGCYNTWPDFMLRRFKERSRARPLQAGDRISKDLTLVAPY